MSVETDLGEETEKWLAKIKSKRGKTVLIDKTKSELLENMDAYIADSEHFLKKGDLIRAFEAVIWSWANLELGLQLGILEQVRTTNHRNHAAVD
jgi:hypothetical protein